MIESFFVYRSLVYCQEHSHGFWDSLLYKQNINHIFYFFLCFFFNFNLGSLFTAFLVAHSFLLTYWDHFFARSWLSSVFIASFASSAAVTSLDHLATYLPFCFSFSYLRYCHLHNRNKVKNFFFSAVQILSEIQFWATQEEAPSLRSCKLSFLWEDGKSRWKLTRQWVSWISSCWNM